MVSVYSVYLALQKKMGKALSKTKEDVKPQTNKAMFLMKLLVIRTIHQEYAVNQVKLKGFMKLLIYPSQF